MARATGAAGAAFESRAARTRAAITSTIWTAIGTASTAVGASTTAAISIASAALRALETRARIAANAGGIAREIFARSGSAADARRARFAREKNDVVLDDGRSHRGFACVRFDDFGFGVLVLASFVLVVVSVFRVFVFRVLVHGVFGIAKSGGVFGAFVGGVGFEFSSIRGAVLFHFFGFILGEFTLGGGLIFRGVEVGFFLAFLFLGFFFGEICFRSRVNLFGLVFLKFGAAGEGIGFGVIGSFLVFCLGEFKREGRGLLFAQIGIAARGHRI